MSRFEGPQGIVTNGLVLNLDAGDPDSYTRSQPPYVEVLVVAGGGGGGSFGGGAGAGGLIYNSAYQLTNAAAITVTVGGGGAGATTSDTGVSGSNGSNSVFGSLTAIGGGGGGSRYGSPNYLSGPGGNGGSGGGSSMGDIGPITLGGTATAGQGNNGGIGFVGSYKHGGGGGAGQVGQNATITNAGNGGNGQTFSISGTSTTYAGGGGGGIYVDGGTAGTGGTGGGGNGNGFGAPGNGVANTGGGGGGGPYTLSYNNPGGTGGSGIVIVRYPGLPAATGGTITYLNGYTIHTFTSSGIFTPFLWNDVSGNNNNGTLNNGTAFIPNIQGGYFNFDGTDDNVTIPNSSIPSTATTNKISICFWSYGVSETTSNSIIEGRNSNGDRTVNIHMPWVNNVIYWDSPDRITYQLAAGQSLGWHYWSFTKDPSTGVTAIYQDGTLLINGGGYNASIDPTTAVKIGSYAINTTFWPGRIGVFQIYNRALSQTEITQNFNAQYNRFGIGLPASGLVLNLDANNLSSYPGTGNTWYDISGNNYNGTLTNGASFLTTTYGGCFNFDGVDDYVDLQYAIIGGTGDFTVNQWIQSNASEIGGTTFGNFGAGALQVFYGNTYMGFWLANDSAYVAAPVPFLSTPVMITAIRSGTTTYFYQNGVLLKTGSSSSNIGAANFRIGTNTSTNEQFTGRVFTTQAYNRALSVGEILGIYATQKSRFGL